MQEMEDFVDDSLTRLSMMGFNIGKHDKYVHYGCIVRYG